MTRAEDDGETVFEEPARWRIEVVERLGLTGEERIAGLANGAGYPDALQPVADALRGGAGVVVDVGAGLGAVSQWLATAAGRQVAAVEPEWASARSARRAFPDLPVAVGTAVAVPAATGSCGGLTLFGVLSLVEDLRGPLAEAGRVVRRDGVLGISDLGAAGATVRSGGSPADVFRPIDTIVDAVVAAGFVVEDVWSAAADTPTAWTEPGRRIDDEVARLHAGSPELAAWLDDQRRLHDLVASGTLRTFTVVARRR